MTSHSVTSPPTISPPTISPPTISHTVLLGLGANLGDRKAVLLSACDILAQHCLSLRASPIYETAPIGFTEQSAFLNMVVQIQTMQEPDDLFALCKSIERTLGRQERPRWHEREIDIDILLVDAMVFCSEHCTIPHPRMHERRFVLEPSAALAPTMRHPVLGETLQTLLAQCQDMSAVALYAE